jgi:uncharacterized protein YndB with AHSA1/START domain
MQRARVWLCSAGIPGAGSRIAEAGAAGEQKGTPMSEAPGLSQHELALTRTLDAPREAVWAAWVTPVRIEQWFAPRPVAIKPGSVVADARPGGEFSLTMVLPDGSESRNTGAFGDVDEPRRLTFESAVEDHPGITGAATSVDFNDIGSGRTEVAVSHTLTCSAELHALATRGWEQALDQLAEVVARA